MHDGKIDVSTADTTPGAKSPLAPPADFTGNADDWWQLMRDRYRCDPGFRQQLAVMVRGRRVALMDIRGPFAIAAKELLTRVAS